uniref:(northern house mosquito) hypothetical protein n=1 Tax=Culex pipiens TaxID=7175 RepID=A0A8D8G9Y7_CULPI
MTEYCWPTTAATSSGAVAEPAAADTRSMAAAAAVADDVVVDVEQTLADLSSVAAAAAVARTPESCEFAAAVVVAVDEQPAAVDQHHLASPSRRTRKWLSLPALG